MSVEEYILLAGGLGSRLRSVVHDRPKALAEVAGKPFLIHLLDRAERDGFRRIILATGYKGDMIRSLVGTHYGSLSIAYSHEDTPLGTGGALWQAFGHCRGERAFVSNADTLTSVDYQAMATQAPTADIIMSVKEVDDRARYGSVITDGSRIRGFEDKGLAGPGLINTGVYLLRCDLLARVPYPSPFSFENDILQPHVNDLNIQAYRSDGYFIDIGVPADYERAQRELAEAS